MSDQKPSATVHRKTDDEGHTFAQKLEQLHSCCKIQNYVVYDFFSEDCHRWEFKFNHTKKSGTFSTD